MRLPTSAAKQYGITRRALGSFGNTSVKMSIDWNAPTEQYSVFTPFYTDKGASGPSFHVSRARWELPDGSTYVATEQEPREFYGGGKLPCVEGAKRAVCGRPAEGTRYPRSTFCECMFGKVQPFIGFCNEASKSYEPWTHEGMAEMVKLAKQAGYDKFNPWSTPEVGLWKPHLEWRKVWINTDQVETIQLTDPYEYFNVKASRLTLMPPTSSFESVCPQPSNEWIVGTLKPLPLDPVFTTGGTATPEGNVAEGTPVGAVVGGPVTLIPNVGGGSTVVPGLLPTVLCGKGLVYAIGKDGQPTCAKPQDLEPKKETNLLPLLAAAAAAYFLL